MCEGVSVLIKQLERASNEGLAAALVGLRYTLALHALLLKLEIIHQAASCKNEEDGGFPGERLVLRTTISALSDGYRQWLTYPELIPALGLLHSLVSSRLWKSRVSR